MLHGHEMVLPITTRGELSESFLDDLFGPSESVLSECLATVSDVQDKQVANMLKSIC